MEATEHIKVTRHAIERFRQRRRNFKHRGLRGVAALKARLNDYADRITDTAPEWYRGEGQDGSHYLPFTPTLCAILMPKGEGWIAVTVVSKEHNR